MIRALYRVLFWIVLPFALIRLAWRARRQPEYLRNLSERFGRSAVRCRARPIWVHAVSVGETRAAEPLIRALLDRHPDIPLLLTCSTPTGRSAGAQVFGERVTQVYLPYDLPSFVRRFLDAHQPRITVLMETELWPELIFQCRSRQIPVHVVNARLSARSAQRYALARDFVGDVLRAVHAVAAQSEADAERFRDLGAMNVLVCGNLKFDRTATPADETLATSFRQRFGGRRAVLAASTREGEEELLLDAWRDSSHEDLLLVLVPRHPQRFNDVARLVAQRGLAIQRRSDDAAVSASTDVWLGDSMGEMYAYHAACDVSLIGGSFLKLGGQNLLEACAVGAPVIVGPHMFNFADATRLALDAGAALLVPSARDAVEGATQLMRDAERANAMGENGRALMRAHQGATKRALDLLGL